MAYATVDDVQSRLNFTMSTSERNVCSTLLDEAALIIDAYNVNASADNKKTVSCRMVARVVGNSDSDGVPAGVSQGSMSGLGYTQSWTMSSGGSVGELYISKLEKKLLGCSDKIGTYSPIEELAVSDL